ncbi:MAG: hypothetical protein ENTB_01872 [Enterocloster aldenensis]
MGRSAVAASAYMSCSRILNDYDGVQHDYTRKQGLVWQEVFLPPMAPAEWRDRSVLWNAVEEVEKTKDSRLAREFVVALPVELDREHWRRLLTGFIQEQFVYAGMCADVAIHDTDGHNPHAHILLTVRPLAENGKWQSKTEKEYLCVRDGEERGFTAAEFKAAQKEGWEKQYQYKVGRKKVYMTPSAAELQGLERVSKYPKSTKYGRQNPISERWNSDEQLVLWRAAWADEVNRALEQAGRGERIDHRSHAERGLDEQPTIHEGVVARAIEKQGIVSDRCELNRQIKADNALIRKLKDEIQKLTRAVRNTVPAMAEVMESLRGKILIFCYQLRYIRAGKESYSKRISAIKPDLERYASLVKQIKAKSRERKNLLAEKKSTPALSILKHRELASRIAELTEDLEELRSEKEQILRMFDCADDKALAAVKSEVASLEASLRKLNQQEEKYSAELDTALTEFSELRTQAAELDPFQLQAARQDIRPDKEQEAVRRLQDAYGERFISGLLEQGEHDMDELLGEGPSRASIRAKLRQHEQEEKQENIMTHGKKLRDDIGR